jgi:ComF family protein
MQKLSEYLKTAGEKLFDLFFPPLCSSCKNTLQKQEKELWICANCFKAANAHFHFFCPVCKNRIPQFKAICHKKEKFILGASFDFSNEIIKNLIHNLKYSSAKKAAVALGFFMAQYLLQINGIKNLKNEYPKFYLLPVPLSKIKERKRGYNQAALIAEQFKIWVEKIDKENILPALEIQNDAILKVKNNQSQTAQKCEAERIKNVEGVFKLNPKVNFKNKNLIILDDVFTSGATTREISKILKNEKVKKIIVLVSAKA